MKNILKVIAFIINWILGFLFILFGVILISSSGTNYNYPNSTSIVPGSIMIIWGLILLPPSVKFVEEKLNIILTTGIKATIFLVTFCIFVVSVNREGKNLKIVNTDNYNITEQNSNSQQTLKEPEKEDNKQKSQNTTPKPKISQKPNKKPTKNKTKKEQYANVLPVETKKVEPKEKHYKPKSNFKRISAIQLTKDYSINAPAADAKYSDRRWAITGIVYKTGTYMDTPYIALKGWDVDFWCLFGKDEEYVLSEVSEGQEVLLEGDVFGTSAAASEYSILADGCEIK